MRGDGFVFRRGNRWWIAYYLAGKYVREPAGDKVATKKEARDRLREVHRQQFAGTYQAPEERRVTVASLLDELAGHLKLKGAASTKQAASHMKTVKASLGHVRASDLTTAMVERYQQERLDLGRAPATVNREVELLRQAYRRASRQTPPRVQHVPLMPLLKVQNARQGFLSPADFAALLAHIDDADIRDFLDWSGWTGMRPNETRQLTWEMLDRSDPKQWTLTLDPKAAKIRKGRVLAIEGPLREIMERRDARRDLKVPLIFHRTSKGKAGRPIIRYDRAWRAALKAASLPAGLRPYDLRRSALRNLIRAGVDVTVAMRISGHKTRSTFDRYNIVDVEDVRSAILRVTEYVAKQPAERKVASMAEPSQNPHNSAPAPTTPPKPAPSRPTTYLPWQRSGMAEARGNRRENGDDTPDDSGDEEQ